MTNDRDEALKAAVARNFLACFRDVDRLAESPIERTMLWALLATDGAGPEPRGTMPCGDTPRPVVELNSEVGYRVWLVPQMPVQAGGSAYRLDFAAIIVGHILDEGETMRIRIDLECDGFAFHDKTKEQAERDRQRDRNLQGAGWIVARFTGSEIHRDPRGTADKFWALVGSLTDRHAEAERSAYRSPVVPPEALP